MTKSRFYGLAVASTILVTAACQSTQTSDTAGDTSDPSRATTANAADSLADTTRRDSTTTPPTTPPDAR